MRRSFAFRQQDAPMDFFVNTLNFLQNKSFDVFGQLITYGGGSVAIAYLFFKFLGQTWIEQKFAERLEFAKHELSKEIEKQKLQIDALLNRVNKLHEKEFEILPEIWKLLNEAHNRIQSVEIRLDSHPDFNNMDIKELENFIEHSELNFNAREKDLMLNSKDKTDLYSKIIKNRALRFANISYVEFHNYLTKNQIFICSALKLDLIKIDKIMWDLWTASYIHEAYKDLESNGYSFVYNKYKENDEPIKKLMHDIEGKIHSRLYPLVQDDASAIPMDKNN